MKRGKGVGEGTGPEGERGGKEWGKKGWRKGARGRGEKSELSQNAAWLVCNFPISFEPGFGAYQSLVQKKVAFFRFFFSFCSLQVSG